ncbi:hypothetical protein M407DRAFT_109094 [Tulasnella calospora MUT 4182]|uniref:Protein kinase domain-containing protein n=1 Tax=Tulasnella calospora MUT 4182 TaxID=1051891 RepID=A0A0C3LQ50_9AGAM|nr:hypothetical protein M407DRAFT_109094 [Tulasnella calospora MUT 4182]
MATSRPPAKRQTSVVKLLDIPVLVSSETVFDFARLAASCAPIPALGPVVESLQKIYNSVQRVYWNRSRCYKLSAKALTLVFVICDHYDNDRADKPKLDVTIKETVRAMLLIDNDVQDWAALSFWRNWYLRHEIDEKIGDHEEKLKSLTENLSLAAILQIHDQILDLQDSLKNNPSDSVDRKKAQEQIYRLRSAAPGEFSALTPAELACECVRLGSQAEYSGTRNDIWKGRWLEKQDVALIFNKEYKMGARDHDSIRRFDRQIKVWRRLNSPFVLRLHGWCKFDGETYLVSPWLLKGDVVRYLAADRNRHQKCIPLIVDIARGLDYLHMQDIIHGSLKPSNILINDDGRAVLSDFSLAKPACVGAKFTQVNPQVNVFRYQAPEVISDEPISWASDVYSWAMTALEIITGQPPFHTWTSPGQLISHITKNDIPIRSDYQSPVLDKHPEIWDLFVRCWTRVPTDRPTAQEVIQEMEKIPAME